MSKKWKIAIGVVMAAMVIAGIALTVWGAVTFRNKAYEYGWRPGEWRTEAASQLEVRLVDDDGDGVPDRGVIEVPEDLQRGRGYGPHFGRGYGPHFGRGYGPHFGRGFAPHFGRGFGPFLVVGGLFRLAFLALLIGLGVACFRCWSRAKEAREPQRG
jgi:hypothetical protein